jgi:hypothetical protein
LAGNKAAAEDMVYRELGKLAAFLLSDSFQLVYKAGDH